MLSARNLAQLSVLFQREAVDAWAERGHGLEALRLRRIATDLEVEARAVGHRGSLREAFNPPRPRRR